MSTSLGKIPKIPAISRTDSITEFSGEIEGGTLWQVLRVEESLLRNILLQLSPVDLLNLEKTCVLMRNLIVQNKVWKTKLLSDFSHLLANTEVADKLELVVTAADEKHAGDVVKNENWSYKLKYVHCWNLQLNWERGHFLQRKIKTPNKIENKNQMQVTNFSVIDNRLFCLKTKTVLDLGFDNIWSVVEVSPKIILIFGTPNIKLVEKNSLKTLEECECPYGLGRGFVGTSPPSVIEDKVVFFAENGKAHVFKFQVDPPCIDQVTFDPVEQQLLDMPTDMFYYDDEYLYDDYEDVAQFFQRRKAYFTGQYCIDKQQACINLYKADFSNVENKKKLHQKVWSLDITGQTSHPEIKFTSAMIDFPFMYVGKTNGVLEVWDVTKDEIVRTVHGLQSDSDDSDDSDILICTIKQNGIGKVCVSNRSNAMWVMDANLLKSGADAQHHYCIEMEDEVQDDEIKVDSTCIMHSSNTSCMKYDFWPIYPANFNPVVGKEALVKGKRSADQSCSSGDHGPVKKHRVGYASHDSVEYVDSKKEEDFNKRFLDNPVYKNMDPTMQQTMKQLMVYGGIEAFQENRDVWKGYRQLQQIQLEGIKREVEGLHNFPPLVLSAMFPQFPQN